MTSGSTACTNSSTGSVQTWRWFHRRCPRNPGWLSLADTLPTQCAWLYSKVSLTSCHSSPHNRLVAFVSRTTPPLRSTFITKASSLLRAAPLLVPTLVFFLMVSAICHFPSHSEQSSHVPY